MCTKCLRRSTAREGGARSRSATRFRCVSSRVTPHFFHVSRSMVRAQKHVVTAKRSRPKMQRASEAEIQSAILVLKGKASGGCSLQLALGAKSPSAAVFQPIVKPSDSCDQALCRRLARKMFPRASDAPNSWS